MIVTHYSDEQIMLNLISDFVRTVLGEQSLFKNIRLIPVHDLLLFFEFDFLIDLIELIITSCILLEFDALALSFTSVICSYSLNASLIVFLSIFCSDFIDLFNNLKLNHVLL